MSGVLNIIIGLILLGGGLSGKIALIGTSSSKALAVVGGVITAIGVLQIVKAKNRKNIA